MTGFRNLTVYPDYRVIITPQGQQPISLRKLSSISTRVFMGASVSDCSIGIVDADAEAYHLFDAMDVITVDFKAIDGNFYRAFTGYLDSVTERFDVGGGRGVAIQASSPYKLFTITAMTPDQQIQFTMFSATEPLSTDVLNMLCDFVGLPKEQRVFSISNDARLKPSFEIDYSGFIGPMLNMAERQAIAPLVQMVAENSSHELYFNEYGAMVYRDVDFRQDARTPIVINDLWVINHDISRGDKYFKSEIQVFGDAAVGGNQYGNQNTVILDLQNVVGAEVAQSAQRYRERYASYHANWLFQRDDIKRYADFLMRLSVNSAVQCSLTTIGLPEARLGATLQYPSAGKAFNIQAISHHYTENQGFTTTFGLAYGRAIVGRSIEVFPVEVERVTLSAPSASGKKAQPQPPNPQAGDVVSYARSQIGNSYVWGGSDPNVGFDCSGLVWWAYKQVGISIERQSYFQWAEFIPVNTPPINFDDLDPGDLVFFSTDGKGGASHVGMYSGNGKMINAPNFGIPVREEAIAGSWLYQYIGANRPSGRPKIKQQSAAESATSSGIVPGFASPLSKPYTILSRYGDRIDRDSPNNGIDIQVAAGTSVYAAAGGQGSTPGTYDPLNEGWVVEVAHSGGWKTRYTYLLRPAQDILDHNNIPVDNKTVIGYVGHSGRARGSSAYLHFEIITPSGDHVDPESYITF
ncbi:MAG: NlpC/P60 family protein [Chloroflexi bacterium]|nr:NlpC/P60 family protein [Chloroflexota bacterium]